MKLARYLLAWTPEFLSLLFITTYSNFYFRQWIHKKKKHEDNNEFKKWVLLITNILFKNSHRICTGPKSMGHEFSEWNTFRLKIQSPKQPQTKMSEKHLNSASKKILLKSYKKKKEREQGEE